MTDKIKADIKKLDGSQVEISGTIAWADLQQHYAKAVDSMQKNIEIDGFRKGHAPVEKVEAHIGQMAILNEAAQYAISDWYPAVIMQEELKVLGYPAVNITKLAPDNDMEFSMTVAVFPEIKLADYKKIAKEALKDKAEVVVEQKDIDETLDRIVKMQAQQMQGTAVDQEGEEADPSTGSGQAKPAEAPTEITDELVTQITGGEIKDVAAFTERVKTDLQTQKESEQQAGIREKMMLELADKSTFDTPEALVEAELDKMVAQQKDEIARMGLEYAKFLEHMGKNEEELCTEWTEDAKKRVAAELLLQEIATIEKLTPDATKVDEQIKAIVAAQPEAPEAHVRSYVENVFRNEATLEFLEGQG